MPVGRIIRKDGKRPASVSAQASSFLPRDLGAALIAMWDAERMAAGDVVGGLAAAWTDAVGGVKPVQATAASQPAYATTAFAGRPALIFDGTDDYLSLESMPLPTTNFEAWVLCSLSPLLLGIRRSFSFGVPPAATACRVGVTSTDGIGSQAQAGVSGTTLNDPGTSFFGNHLQRVQVGTSGVTMTVDGTSTTASAATLNIGTARICIGSTDNAPADRFWKGGIAAIIVTAPLSVAQAAALTGYLKTRGGIA